MNPSLSSSSLPEAVFRILLAEDDRINARYLALALKQEGIASLETAENGGLALKLWSEKRHALVFVDYQMPELDGIGLIREIRRIEKETAAPRTLLVGLTAAAESGVYQQFLEAGADAYLTKPISRSEIARILAKLRSGR